MENRQLSAAHRFNLRPRAASTLTAAPVGRNASLGHRRRAVSHCHLRGFPAHGVAQSTCSPGAYRARAQNLVLLVASYFFYGWWDWRFLGLIASELARRLQRRHHSRCYAHAARAAPAMLLASLVVNLGILGFFKYYDFFVDRSRPPQLSRARPATPGAARDPAGRLSASTRSRR